MCSVKYFIFVLSIYLFKLIVQVLTEKCITPDNNEGECISLYSCPSLAALIVTQKSESIEFVRRSNCGAPGVDPKVCCRSMSPELLEHNSGSTTTAPKKRLLSDRRFCGFQHSDDYFRTDNVTSIDEFPWLVYLIYETKDGIRANVWWCSGVVISRRYVLTQDGCFSSPEVHLAAVRVGDHDIKTDVDCAIDTELEDCSLPYEEIGVEAIIRYSESIKDNGNNLALIRLNQSLEYSDYIRPICLPEYSTKSKEGDTLLTACWGFTTFGFYPRKTKILARLTSNEECSGDFPGVNVSDNHFCTTDLTGKEFPQVFTFGGPLMVSIKSQWQLEGIDIYSNPSPKRLHIKIANYMEWIEKNVKS